MDTKKLPLIAVALFLIVGSNVSADNFELGKVVAQNETELNKKDNRPYA